MAASTPATALSQSNMSRRLRYCGGSRVRNELPWAEQVAAVPHRPSGDPRQAKRRSITTGPIAGRAGRRLGVHYDVLVAQFARKDVTVIFPGLAATSCSAVTVITRRVLRPGYASCAMAATQFPEPARSFLPSDRHSKLMNLFRHLHCLSPVAWGSFQGVTAPISFFRQGERQTLPGTPAYQRA